jgi:hypothetical protein
MTGKKMSHAALVLMKATLTKVVARLKKAPSQNLPVRGHVSTIGSAAPAMDDANALMKQPGGIRVDMSAEFNDRWNASQERWSNALAAVVPLLAATHSEVSVELRRTSIAPARAALDEMEASTAYLLEMLNELFETQARVQEVDLSGPRAAISAGIRSSVPISFQGERDRLDALELALKDVTGSFGRA